jgi:hypothetical protein
MPTLRPKLRKVARRKPSAQSHCKTSFGEFVRVAITQFDLDPTIFNGLIQPSLEIGISHIDEMIASKYAARTNRGRMPRCYSRPERSHYRSVRNRMPVFSG